MLKHILLLIVSAIFLVAGEDWEDTPETTLVWQLISTNQNHHLHQFFIDNPAAMTMRSGDGRGALWWAWEYKNAEALAILAVHGIDLHYTNVDRDGHAPKDLCDDYESVLAQAQQHIPEKKAEKAAIEEHIRREKEKMRMSDDESIDDDDEDDEDEYESNEFDDSEDDDLFHDEI